MSLSNIFMDLSIELLPDHATEQLSFEAPRQKANGSWGCKVKSDGNRLDVDTEIVGENALQCVVLIPVFLRRVIFTREDVAPHVDGVDVYITTPEYIPFA